MTAIMSGDDFDATWLLARYGVDGLSCARIARELGTYEEKVRRALIAHGIERRPPNTLHRSVPELLDANWLRSRYVTDGAGMPSIARELRVSPRTVWWALRRHGIPTRPRSQDSRPAELNDKRWLAEAVRSRSYRSIAAELGVSPSTVLRATRRLGITP